MLNFTQYYNSARFLFRTTFYEVVILGQAKPDNNFGSQYASKMVAEGGIEHPEAERRVVMSHLRYLFSHPANFKNPELFMF